ncbi:MAG: hypothetical protein ACO4CT_08640 [Planctomycetota bacterium]|jgi:hypothetical protein
MAHPASIAEARAITDLIRLLEFDPWSLTPAERSELRAALVDAQKRWLPRIVDLVEPPVVDDAFPAFLLDTPAFADLADGIGDAHAPCELGTGTADRLQRFVDRYRTYLAA